MKILPNLAKTRTLSGAVLALSITVLSGCDAISAGNSEGYLALKNFFSQNGYECGGQDGTTRLQWRTAGTQLEQAEYQNLGFKVVEEDVTAAEQANGLTSKGWVIFDEKTIYRYRGSHLGWNWTDWQQPLAKEGEESGIMFRVQSGNLLVFAVDWGSRNASKTPPPFWQARPDMPLAITFESGNCQ